MNEFFEKLINKIKTKDTIILMTHKNMDLDGFSSSLCLFNIIKKLNKECYIYLSDNQTNEVIKNTMHKLKISNYEYNTLYQKDLNKYSLKNTLLIIVDIYKKHLVENETLLEKIDDIAVIDHHIQDNDYISNATYTYINPEMSSVAEIMVHFSKYLDYQIDPLLSTILLCAIEIDTNNYNFKTKAETYEAAAYLTRCGATTIVKQELLRESKETYLERQSYIENSYQITENIILCKIEDKVVSSSYLAIIADSLLQFKNIEASFCIGKVSDNTIGISARSIGNIDVQQIMCKLGGGGHKTDAATKIEGKNIENCEQELINIIKEV